MIDFLINKIGFSVCHQIPDRSIQIDSVLMPICSRCSGIYIGFTIGVFILFAMFRKKHSSLAPVYSMILFVIFIISVAVDGLLSYMSAYETNNFIRLLTGYLCGLSLAAIILPIFNYQFYEKPLDRKIFERLYMLILYFLFASPVFLLLVFKLGFTSIFFYYFSIFSVIFTFFFVNLVIIFFIPYFAKKTHLFFSRYLLFSSIIAIAFTVLELYASYRLHVFFLKS